MGLLFIMWGPQFKKYTNNFSITFSLLVYLQVYVVHVNICMLICVCACVSHSVMSDSATHGLQLSRLPCPCGFSTQEYWNGWPFPSPGDLPDPGIKPVSPALQADSLPFGPPGKLLFIYNVLYI